MKYEKGNIGDIRHLRMKTVIVFLAAAMTIVSTGSPQPVSADLTMPSIFSDNMVLQRGIEIPVWGWADPGDSVTVSIDSLRVHAVAGLSGRWTTKLGGMEAGGPHEMIVAGDDTLRFNNVMIGEVWVCSGQSNMQWSMRNLIDAESDIASATFPNIRLFTVPRRSADIPQDDFAGERPGWAPCTPDTVLSFSAIAYYFGKELHTDLRMPIGLIHTSWGGSVAEAWTSMATLDSIPELRPIVDNLDSVKANYQRDREVFLTKQAAYAAARKDSLNLPLMPLPPRGPGERDYPSGLFNAMIYPLIPYGIAGAIWYQGESNSVRAAQYRTLFPAMITDWRKAWNQGDFPFIYVQLANWETDTIPVEGGWGSWPELREAQLMTLSLPNTGMAVAIDIGEADNIHPNNKREAGRRLALNALAVAYDRRIVKSGPIYTSWYRESDTIRLRFRHTGQGLLAGNMLPLSGFEIAGRDRIFHSAEARIDGTEVVVYSPNVKEPAAVRYAWDDNPECNLFNMGGLPASPFRTDTWPGVTDGRLRP